MATIAKCLKTGTASVTIVITIVLISVPLFDFLNRSAKEAKLKAVVEAAGGPAIICKEASAILQSYGGSSWRLFDDKELYPFPAITSLGKVDGIWSEHPPRIKIRQYTVLDHFVIDLVKPEDFGAYQESHPHILAGISPCIFARE